MSKSVSPCGAWHRQPPYGQARRMAKRARTLEMARRWRDPGIFSDFSFYLVQSPPTPSYV